MVKVCLLAGMLTMSVTSLTVASDVRPENPHTSSRHCEICHVLSEAELQKSELPGAKKRDLRGGANGVCTQCHKVSLGHGVGKKPERNTEKLPVHSDGTIACAFTCHNIHLQNPETAAQKRYFLRLPHRRLCVSCHTQ